MPIDMRTRKLAQLAVKRCVNVKAGDRVIISGGEEAIPFMVELYKAVVLLKAHPIVRFNLPNVSDFFYKHATQEQIERFPEEFMDTLKKANKYIGIYTDENTRMLSNCDPRKMALRSRVTKPISTYICDSEHDVMKRTTIAYPCQAHAQEADMSLDEYEKFVYDACLQDWNKISKQMNLILKKFKNGKNVHLLGENVDLKFKIRNELATTDLDGDNMPMGEVFMAPIRDSLNGWIKFEYPAIENGNEVTDIYLKFENGKVIDFDATKNRDFLKQMLEIDENASYVGEFGIGCNPNITKFTKNLLFDEKIGGTIHLALGNAYKINGGGNDSAIHWDIVKDMSKAQIILDGKVVQDKGKWKIRGVDL